MVENLDLVVGAGGATRDYYKIIPFIMPRTMNPSPIQAFAPSVEL